MPGSALAFHCCTIDAPDPPMEKVYRTGPYASMKCSLAIISDSACTTRLQLVPVASKAVDIVAKPRARTLPYSTPGAAPSWYDIPHPAPPMRKSLRFQPACGFPKSQDLDGSYRTAI